MKLNNVKEQMCDNLDKVMEREGNIEVLEERTNSMNIGATTLNRKVRFMNS